MYLYNGLLMIYKNKYYLINLFLQKLDIIFDKIVKIYVIFIVLNFKDLLNVKILLI